jgi:hypothetical protein
MFGPGFILHLLVGRPGRRDQQHPIEAELEPGLLGADQMTDVRGVEGPTKDPDSHGDAG